MKQVAKTYPALLEEFEFVPVGDTRRITDAYAAYNELQKILGDATAEVFFPACTVSLKKLVEGAAKVFEREGNTEPPDVIGFIGHLIEQKPKEPKLAKKK